MIVAHRLWPGNLVNRNERLGILPGKSAACPGERPLGDRVSSSPTSANGREAEVRERIFASALRHFSQKGFAATSLREVSLDEQTTKLMIYYYLGSNEERLGSVVRDIQEEKAEAHRADFLTVYPFELVVFAYDVR